MSEGQAAALLLWVLLLIFSLRGALLDEAKARAIWAGNEYIRQEADSAALSPADAATRPDITLAGVARQGDALCAWAAFDPLRWTALHALRLAARTLASLQHSA